MATASIAATFRAYQYDRFGRLDQELKLRENVAQKPLLPSQVRVKVLAASVNPADYIDVELGDKLLPGALPSPTPSSPFGFGFDLAGTIVEVGANAKRFKVGDEVFAMAPWNAFGTVAEYFPVDEAVLALKPANITFEQAGATPLTALTSYQALFQHAKLQSGETVLILGGSSSCGSFAVQLAKSVGAKVIATTSGANVELVKSIGADQVVDYKTQKWADVLDAHSVDVLYDCGMEPDAWNTGAQKVLKASTGRYATLWPLPEPVREAKFGAINVGHVQVHPVGEDLEKVGGLLASGKVVPLIDSVVTMEELDAAIAHVQSRRARGKVVIHVQ